MASEELVTEQFQFLGIEVEKEVLSKCVSLCEEYNVDAESFIEQWMAFSLNHLNGASPTLENLDVFERKEFSKRAANRVCAPAKENQRAVAAGAGLTVYGAPVAPQPENEVISNYMATTPKRVKVEVDSGNQTELCPATYSPTIASAKYASRTNAGTVVHSYGDEQLLKKITDVNAVNNVLNLKIQQVPNDDGDVYNKARFGFELLHEKASIFDSHIQYVSQYIMRKAGITESTSVRQKSQTEITVAGRIECDADARLNPKCVVLQGTWEQSLSQSVPVDIDNLKQYALFPGQVVVMRGINPKGDRFTAQEVYCDAALPITDHKHDITNTLTGTMSLVIAAGPYTTSENVTYEPLKDLVSYINTQKPHVVILTGPFMDAEHSKIKDNTMAETYKAFFEKLVDSLGELNNTCPYTKIYIASNIKDAFHVNIYPTPPYSSRRKHPNIYFIADPSTLNINGVFIGVTSTDVLMHVSQEEISLKPELSQDKKTGLRIDDLCGAADEHLLANQKVAGSIPAVDKYFDTCKGSGSDKLSRLASHVITQQTYYPLWPAPLAVDAALWAAHAQLPVTPHLLVLPSNFRYFVKETNGCVVVNPEHMTKGTGGGTFARAIIASNNDKLNVAVQIVRI